MVGRPDEFRLLSLTDGAGNRTLYTYDGFDRISQIDYAHPTVPGTNTGNDDEIFTYDSVGRLSSRRVRSNEQFFYTYDALGRVTNVNAPSGTADTSYTYDLHNNLITITSDGRTITNTFNALGDHLSQAGPNGTVSYLYDSAGRRERMSWPDGNYVTYDWNVASQLTHIRENGASSGIGVLAAFEYDDQGRRTALIRGNGTQTTYSFDAVGRLASLVEDLSGTSHDLTVSFDHNHSGQIIERSVSNASYTYAHSITIDTLFEHNGLNQITSADDGTSVLTPSYDARGNLTAYDGRTFGYDTYNRLTSVGGTGGSMSLEYDPLGRLWETSGPSGAARYQYDGAAIIAAYNASGVMQHRWVHGPGMDEPLVRYDGSGMSNKRWLHADERGSIIAHTDSTGARIQTNSYDAYGNPGATNAGLFQYTGQVWLEDAGVYYYKNRTYHAELGRFMQADPIGHSGGINLYAYVGGDPVNFTDPWGLRECGALDEDCEEEDDNVEDWDCDWWEHTPNVATCVTLVGVGGLPGSMRTPGLRLPSGGGNDGGGDGPVASSNDAPIARECFGPPKFNSIGHYTMDPILSKGDTITGTVTSDVGPLAGGDIPMSPVGNVGISGRLYPPGERTLDARPIGYFSGATLTDRNSRVWSAQVTWYGVSPENNMQARFVNQWEITVTTTPTTQPNTCVTVTGIE